MSKPESADDRVKRIIGEGEMLRVGLTVLDGGVEALSQLYHLRRQIDTYRDSTPVRRFGRKPTWPTRDIQQACTRARKRT